MDQVNSRGSAALDGAQASDDALHADRCVQQYGLSWCVERSARGKALGDDGPFAGRGIELGSLYAAEPVTTGLRHRWERYQTRDNEANLWATRSLGVEALRQRAQELDIVLGLREPVEEELDALVRADR